MTKRLGFFTRLLDETNAAERYRLATAQIVQAERSGFDSAWIAQHHFHEAEGGLPAPFVFLAHAAAATIAHPARHRHRHPAARTAGAGRRGCRRARPAERSSPRSRRRAGRQSHGLHRLRSRQQGPSSPDERQSRADAHGLGGRRAAGRRPALSRRARRWSIASGRRPSRSRARAAPARRATG